MSTGINIITDHHLTAENFGGLLSKLDLTRTAMNHWKEIVCHDRVHAGTNWRWAWDEDFDDPGSYWSKGNSVTAFFKDGVSIRVGQFSAIISVPAVWSFVMQDEKYMKSTRKLATDVLQVLGGSSMLVVPSSSAYCAERAASNVDSQLTFDAILKAYKDCIACNNSGAPEKYLLWR